jgi:hypothetical protein
MQINVSFMLDDFKNENLQESARFLFFIIHIDKTWIEINMISEIKFHKLEI